MTAARTPHDRPISRRNPRSAHHLLALPAALFACGIVLAASYVAYVLWPRFPAAAVPPDAPSLPVIVGGTTFNIPPAAIRRPVQRRPGVQDRVDLAFLWPSLSPPDPAARPLPTSSAQTVDRVFATIVVGENAMPPAERARTIYPRYLDTQIGTGPGGLAARPFRDGTPYQSEDLIYDPRRSDGLMVRCTRNGPAATLGMCLYDRRIGDAEISVRFPRDWLEDWEAVAHGLDRLIAGLRASSR